MLPGITSQIFENEEQCQVDSFKVQCLKRKIRDPCSRRLCRLTNYSYDIIIQMVSLPKSFQVRL